MTETTESKNSKVGKKLEIIYSKHFILQMRRQIA